MLGTIVILGLIGAVPVADAARPAYRDPDPAIRLTLSHDGAYTVGQWARVHVRAARDGYLLVLQSDPQGRVRVLFPVDPVDDHFIPGQRDFELRGRGDRDAFQVESELGTGVVLAAWAPDPFSFGEFRRGQRWDLRALDIPASELDLERGLTDLATRMAPPGGFDYDVLRYTVSEETYAASTHYYGGAPTCFGCSPWGTSVYVSVGSYWYDPWWYDPWYYRPWYGYYPAYYYPYPYYPYRYYPVYSPYPRPYASYPYARNRYTWKDPRSAVAVDRPDYRDRYAGAFRDRTLGAPAATPDAGTRRRLPSIGERELDREAGAGTRRRVTPPSPAAPRQGTDAVTPGRRTTERPAQPERTREAETPRRRTQAQPETRQAEPRKEQPSGGRRTEPAPSREENRPSSTRRRSESLSAPAPARATARQVDARRQSGLPADARVITAPRRTTARPELRPATARRVERPAAETRPAARGGTATPRGVEPRAATASRVGARPESRDTEVRSTPRPSRPAPSASRGGVSGGAPRQASPARGSGGGGRAAAPSGGGGGRSAAPSGGGGGRRR